MHDILFGSANLDDGGDLASPEGEAFGVDGPELVADGSNMMDESQVLNWVKLRVGCREDLQVGERKHPSPLPLFDGGFNLRRPHEIGLVGSGSPVIGLRNVIVRAADLMLGAVSALREVFVTTDVSTLAGITAFAGLGVAPSRRATARTSHW